MSIALTRALAPVMAILTNPKTEDLAIQQPGVGWWLHSGAWHEVALPEMTYARCHGIAVMAAAQTRQVVNPRSPILDCDLLGDLRLMVAIPPAVRPETISLTFRRGDTVIDELSEIPKLFGTSRWNKWGSRNERQQQRDGALLDRLDAGDLEGFLRGLAETRQTGIFVGGTGVGKTRLSKAMTAAILPGERIITIEDAAEMLIRHRNHVRLFYAASGVGVTQARLLKATLRMRPDRIMLAEMRDSEAATLFLNVIMAAHPGSYSTLHGKTAEIGAMRLFNMLTDGAGMNSESIINQLSSAVDFIMPIDNDGGVRDLGEVWFKPDALRRGETFRNLLTAA